MVEILLSQSAKLTRRELDSYDYILCAFSGGKDSVACVLSLLDQGVDSKRFELWHHDVDGCEEDGLMDWPCTRSYVSALSEIFEMPLYLSFKEGGFEREMLRDGTPTAPTHFELPDGSFGRIGGLGAPGSRLRFPQVAADLKVRWCSAYLKIDVMAAGIRNQSRFDGARVLVLSGERAQESAARARYLSFEPDRSDNRSGSKKARLVDRYRPVHSWSERRVWEILRAARINPHPCYRLGWSRCSCAACIFGNADQWASLRVVLPEMFTKIAAYEQRFGCTIKRSENIVQLADRGEPYAAITPELIREARDKFWKFNYAPQIENWQLPAGAFGDSAGPA